MNNSARADTDASTRNPTRLEIIWSLRPGIVFLHERSTSHCKLALWLVVEVVTCTRRATWAFFSSCTGQVVHFNAQGLTLLRSSLLCRCMPFFCRCIYISVVINYNGTPRSVLLRMRWRVRLLSKLPLKYFSWSSELKNTNLPHNTTRPDGRIYYVPTLLLQL